MCPGTADGHDDHDDDNDAEPLRLAATPAELDPIFLMVAAAAIGRSARTADPELDPVVIARLIARIVLACTPGGVERKLRRYRRNPDGPLNRMLAGRVAAAIPEVQSHGGRLALAAQILHAGTEALNDPDWKRVFAD
jgi:hypothetical protein